MFTGIIEKTATVHALHLQGDTARLILKSIDSDLKLGESLSINGVCLTLSECTSEGQGIFWLSPETLQSSNLGSLKPQELVNCERALKVGDRLSGHWVQGHIDMKAKVLNIDNRAEGSYLTFTINQVYQRYMIEKGSVALNGVSLTIQSLAELDPKQTAEDSFQFSISVIPHTWKNTNLCLLRVGDHVNVEFDLMSKYVEQLCRIYLKS